MSSTQNTSRCTACWNTLLPEDLFCSRCGSPVNRTNQAPVIVEHNGSRKRVGGSDWSPESPNAQISADPIELANSTREPRKRRPRSKRPRRFASFLLPLTVALAILAGGLGGRLLSETSSTLDKMHSVSTPPPQVSDSTVRDEPESQQGGSAAALPTQPAEVSTSGASSQPMGEDETGQSAQSGLTPVPTTAEASTSGSSSQPTGANETGQLAQTGITPVPETETTVAGVGVADSPPQPTTSAVMTTAAPDAPQTSDEVIGSTSEPQADGEAMAEQQMAQGMTFDTAPAVAAIAQYQQQSSQSPDDPNTASTPQVQSSESNDENDDGFFGSLAEKGGQLRDAAQGAAIASGLSDPKNAPVTILVMGVDARPGSAIDIGVRPDALMVLRLDPESGACRGLAIPRDSYVELPGYGKTKINHALMLGGIPYEQLVVEQYLGIDIDHYALIDFTGFAELVDAVGGITIDVPPELASPAVPAGVQTIDGETALRHARYRGGPDGDFGRIKRQQQIMRGLIASADGRNLLSEATRLLAGLQDHIRTDMELSELVSLAESYQDRCTVEGLDMAQIPGEVVYGPLIDPLFNLPLSYVVSDPADVQRMVEELQGD